MFMVVLAENTLKDGQNLGVHKYAIQNKAQPHIALHTCTRKFSVKLVNSLQGESMLFFDPPILTAEASLYKAYPVTLAIISSLIDAYLHLAQYPVIEESNIYDTRKQK